MSVYQRVSGAEVELGNATCFSMDQWTPWPKNHDRPGGADASKEPARKAQLKGGCQSGCCSIYLVGGDWNMFYFPIDWE